MSLSFGTELKGTCGLGHAKENRRKDHPAASVTRQIDTRGHRWLMGHGVLIQWPNRENTRKSIHSGSLRTNCKADGNSHGPETKLNSAETDADVVLSVYSQVATFGSFRKNRNAVNSKAAERLGKQGDKQTFQWIPSHTGLCGSEGVDNLAKVGRSETQVGTSAVEDTDAFPRQILAEINDWKMKDPLIDVKAPRKIISTVMTA